MEVKEIKVDKKEKIYTFTESELKELKSRERNFADNCIREYIVFCYNNFGKGGWCINSIIEFVTQAMKFFTGNTNYIDNTEGLDLWEYIKKSDSYAMYKEDLK